ncbi:glycosyltransferase [Actinokineospora sp. HUAS TT18]|uniref:glycosyltransferase n=1 Tax=Actinokineospora sp. HUAS TT18 TaxID=3447451 RepID=UPI003F51B585
MTRYLLVVPPFVGHINPLSAVAAELVERGHQVAWAGDPDMLARLLPEGSTVFPVWCPVPERPADVRGFAAWKFLWEHTLIPLAQAMLPGVLAAIEQWEPGALVVDQQALAGVLAAHRTGLPWATSATTSSEIADPLAAMPAVSRWVTGLLTELRLRFGDPMADHDLRFSPHLVLAFTTEALAGQAAVSAPVRFVGPSRRAATPVDFPWDRLDHRPLVFVSVGTLNADSGAGFLAGCVTALRERPDLQAVVVDPGGTLDAVPDHVLVRREVPQTDVLDRAAVVVCHAGHNTVCEALDRAVPLVVAPIRDDQPVIADQVVRAGAGVRLRFAHARAAQIGSAIDNVLSDDSYRTAAKRIQESFARAGGARAAAVSLEALG